MNENESVSSRDVLGIPVTSRRCIGGRMTHSK
jgi:hypothetical protein